jgi:uncharacterized protein YecE (DUF72 family)
MAKTARAPQGTARIGISGWRYPPWRGVFYPKGLPQSRELEHASRRFNSIEINGSFYSLQKPEFYADWHDRTPEGFVFAVKGGRFITHMKKLRDVETPVANFFASGVLCLRDKLGPVLWQFPPNMGFDEAKFEAFFEMLPRDTEEAASIAQRHDERLEGRAFTCADARRPVRHAVEIRHESFRDPRFVALLRKHAIALVVADTARKWPLLEDVTADFVYVRLHGDEQLYVSGYDDASLDEWARRVQAWLEGGEPADARRVAGPAKRAPRGRDVFVYFDNDAKVRAPFDACGLAKRLGVRWLADGELDRSALDGVVVMSDAARAVDIASRWKPVSRAAQPVGTVSRAAARAGTVPDRELSRVRRRESPSSSTPSTSEPRQRSRGTKRTKG